MNPAVKNAYHQLRALQADAAAPEATDPDSPDALAMLNHREATAESASPETLSPRQQRWRRRVWLSIQRTALVIDRTLLQAMQAHNRLANGRQAAGHDACSDQGPLPTIAPVRLRKPRAEGDQPAPHSLPQSGEALPRQSRRSCSEGPACLRVQAAISSGRPLREPFEQNHPSTWCTLGSANQFRWFRCEDNEACLAAHRLNEGAK